MTRSELKAQDEITTTLAGLTETALTRKREIIIAGAVVVAAVALFFGWRSYSSGQSTAAQRQLAAVINAFQNPTVKVDKERFEKTIVEAQKTMADYPSTHAASMAQYYLALSQDGLGDKANAVKNLEEVIGRGDADVKPVAQFALAGVYRRHGELQKSIDLLKQLDETGGFSKNSVALELGSTAEAASQQDVAQAAYSRIIKESPDSPFRADAEAGLKRMGLPIPAPEPPQVEVK
jgi:predicted negative regulator of RcsB-dependent stress response